jgi:hypothetical protein
MEHDALDDIPEHDQIKPDPLRKLHGKQVRIVGFDRHTGEFVDETGTLILPYALPDDLSVGDFIDDDGDDAA